MLRVVSCCVLGFVFSSMAFAQPKTPPAAPRLGVMTTYVGTGTAGLEGDGGPTEKAKLSQPFHCEVDERGHLYIADALNHAIRKVDLKTGVITTVAGNGKKGYSGDGGPAKEATMAEPYAVAVDAEDNLYIADRLNAAVRKVDGKTGMISTVVGVAGKKGYNGDNLAGTETTLAEPNDVHFDYKGGLLIADVADWRIRRLDLKTGKVTTFAGTGRPAAKGVKGKFDRSKNGDGGKAKDAVIVGARAVCVDGKGNTYICEREGSCVRKVDKDGNITTIGGTGARGYSGDGDDAKRAVFDGPKGIRCDHVGHIYVVDCENHTIRRIDANSNIVRNVAGGQKGKGGDGGPATWAGMDRPHGCCVDKAGHLYIADTNNHRVRKVTVRIPDDYPLGPDSLEQADVPKGKTETFVWHSKVFDKTFREVGIYVPAQYDGKEPACVMVFQDGSSYMNPKGSYRVPIVFDNLIHKKEMPVTIGIFIDPGSFTKDRTGKGDRKNRSFEYDTLSDQYVTMLEKEILPEVAKRYKLRQDAAGRAICGASSGGICAFTAAWQRPDLFSKVLSHIGSFTNIRGGDVYPGMIRKTPVKPIRVFLQDGKNDLNNQHGNWWLGNLQMERSLAFMGYDYKFAPGDGGHNGRHGGAILPESLRWLWRTK